MIELITFILIAAGLTSILVYGKVFDNIRPKHYMFHCSQCMGFHVGWFLLFLSPFTELFNFDVTLINVFLLGWLSSGTSYILDVIFGDSGIQHTQTMEILDEQHMDE